MKRSKNKTKIGLKQGKDKMWCTSAIVRMKIDVYCMIKKRKQERRIIIYFQLVLVRFKAMVYNEYLL